MNNTSQDVQNFNEIVNIKQDTKNESPKAVEDSESKLIAKDMQVLDVSIDNNQHQLNHAANANRQRMSISKGRLKRYSKVGAEQGNTSKI